MSGRQESASEQTVPFLSLKPRMIRLLLEALQCETDSFNVQILLGGMFVLHNAITILEFPAP